MDNMLVQVKKLAESKSSNDIFKILDTLPGDTLFPMAHQSGCTQLHP